WVRARLRSLRELAASIEGRLASGLELPGPLGSIAGTVAGAAAGAEAGAAVGLAGRRVLGQYDVSLADRGRRPRLLLVEPNLAAAPAEIGGRPAAVPRWGPTHGGTQPAQVPGPPW